MGMSLSFFTDIPVLPIMFCIKLIFEVRACGLQHYHGISRRLFTAAATVYHSNMLSTDQNITVAFINY